MKVKLLIDHAEELSKGSVSVCEQKLLIKFSYQFDDCSLVIRCAGSNDLRIYCVLKEVKKQIVEILLQIRDCANDRFCRYNIQ